MLGAPGLKEHVVEFIRGVGIKTDGVVDATSLNGPWTWAPPKGVASAFATIIGAGSSGQGGAAFSAGITSVGGGGGGSSGICIKDIRINFTPDTSVTVTLGAGGSVSAAGAAINAGGSTTISGLLAFGTAGAGASNRGICAVGGTSTQYAGVSPSGSVNGIGQGGGGAYSGSFSAQGAPAPSAATSAGPGAFGNEGVSYLSQVLFITSMGGSSGGNGASSMTVAGGNGGNTFSAGGGNWLFQSAFGGSSVAGVGNTTGTLSRGGGGAGANTLYGIGASGGDGGVAGASVVNGYGCGGGGGGGNASGGAGGDGYVAFTYWRAS